jgi:hypothetical protein
MPLCTLCQQPALYYDLRLGGMACAAHASPDAQIASVRSLTSALLKALTCEVDLQDERHKDTVAIIKQLRPLLKD